MNMRTAFDRMIVLALVAIVAGCAHTVPDDCPVHPKEPAECPEIRSECFSLLFENIATNRIELCGQHGFSGSKEVDELAEATGAFK